MFRGANAGDYRNLRTYLDPAANDRSPVERERAMAKRLILGTLVAVAGTRMLFELLERNTELHLYLNGTLLIVSITLYGLRAPKRMTMKEDAGSADGYSSPRRAMSRMRSAVRAAIAWMVMDGLTPVDVGKTEPSQMKRLGTS
jgi:hypothetical protein